MKRAAASSSYPWVLLAAVLAVLAVGLTVLVSAGGQGPHARADALRQGCCAAVGLVALLAVAHVDPPALGRLARPLHALNVSLLLLVIFLGHAAKGPSGGSAWGRSARSSPPSLPSCCSSSRCRGPSPARPRRRRSAAPT